jgi:hypothetical protein
MNANTAPATMPALDKREHDVAKRSPARRAEACRGELDVVRQRVQADADGAHRERQADDDMSDKQCGEAKVFAPTEILEELEQADAGDERGQHQRAERQGDQRVTPPKAVAKKREGERQREQRAHERRERPELKAEEQRIDPFWRERPLPPAQRKPARREERAVGLVERDCGGDQDRAQRERVDEDHDGTEQRPRALVRAPPRRQETRGHYNTARFAPTFDAP